MLKLSMTYEIITPESAENGEAEEIGFVFEGEECTAKELAHYIERYGFTEPSESSGVPRWLTSEKYREDYRTWEVENRSIHPGRDKQSQRVWRQVLTITGIIKG